MQIFYYFLCDNGACGTWRSVEKSDFVALENDI